MQKPQKGIPKKPVILTICLIPHLPNQLIYLQMQILSIVPESIDSTEKYLSEDKVSADEHIQRKNINKETIKMHAQI